MSTNDQIQQGIAHHQAGRLAEAERLYRQVLAGQPDHSQVLNLLGTLAFQAGKPDAAIELIQRSIALAPDIADGPHNLAVVLRNMGRLDQAETLYRRAIELRPNYFHAHHGLALTLEAKGRIEEAIAEFRSAIDLDPTGVEALTNLGNLMLAHDRTEEAIQCQTRALEIAPDFAPAHCNLGNALRYVDPERAMKCFQRAAELAPDMPEAHNNIGNRFRDKANYEQAIASYTRAIQLRPDAKGYSNLGAAWLEWGRVDQAITAHRKAIEIEPNGAPAHNNLGITLMTCGDLREAVLELRKAVQCRPGAAEMHSNLLLSLNYVADAKPADVVAEHRNWAQRHAEPLRPMIRPHLNTPDPERRLRIGYVSADFQTHAVGYFIQPILAAHDRSEVELYCYSNPRMEDAFTERLQKLANVWRNIRPLGDERAVEMIREDGIDILVDLGGHTRHSRLLLFARKPAPVQVAYLGYPNTTGMDTIDYRISDEIADPPGLSDVAGPEEIIRLPAPAWCYTPGEATPPVAQFPRRDITFGSFNFFAKVSPQAIKLWSEILWAVPKSRLLLKAAGLDWPQLQQRVRERFAEHGIGADRIDFAGWSNDPNVHLHFYDRVHVALDTFPYNGTTTTCEAMWMGVPVVTLTGDRHAGRVGASLLSAVGLNELVAGSPDDYVERACALGEDSDRIAALRLGLRDRMRASPLMDPHRFTRNLEQAYRQMWRKWCGGQ